MKSILTILIVLFINLTLSAQARLNIINNSKRIMTVKVMKGSSGKGTLHEKVLISPYGSKNVYFSESGFYFTKTKAVLSGVKPICRKGDPFKVVNDETGYSEMTLTFTIKESAIPQASGGKQISEAEFDKD